MKKRPRGTGSIFRRGRIWFIQYFADSERRRESSGSDDRKIAVQLLQKRLGDIASGKYQGLTAEAKRATMGRLIDLVIEDYEFRGLRSAQTVAWRASAHFDEAFRNRTIDKFGTEDLKHYIVSRREQGAANATINRELEILRRGYTLGQQGDSPLVHKRPPHISLLQEDNVRQGFLEPEKYEQLLEELPQRLKAIFVCAYHVGSRKGELRKIKWEQIDFEAKLIRLQGSQTKAKKPRTLPIYGDMERWLRIQQETCIPGCPWVFHWMGRQVGNHLRGWHEACERAGVSGLLFHDLRRSAVRNMRRAGIPDHEAMRITGHRTRKTYERYDIIDEEDISNAGEKLDAFFEKRKQDRAAKLERIK